MEQPVPTQQTPSKPGSPSGPTRRRIPWWRKVLYALVPLALLCIIGELVARVRYGALFSLTDARSSQRTMVRNGYPSAYDAQLGWIPRPGASGDENFWHTRVTIDSQGFRSHPANAAAGAPMILAAGDSFTFGDGVNDDESWPANLERLSHERVVNAGVFGYGFDQIVLRTERVAPQVHPEQIVVAFYPGDILRVGFSDYYAQKPYFISKDDKLVLQNVPVPTPDRDKPSRVKVVLGYSYLLNSLFVRLFPAWWLGDARIVDVQNDPPAICQKLLDRLAKAAEAEHCKVTLVAITRVRSDEAEISQSRKLLQAATAKGFETLLLALPRRLENPSKHFNAEGNAWIAEQILRRIEGKAAEELTLPEAN
jgi:hypothetical protein